MATKKTAASSSRGRVVFRKRLTFQCRTRQYQSLLRLAGYAGSGPLGELVVSVQVKRSKLSGKPPRRRK